MEGIERYTENYKRNKRLRKQGNIEQKRRKRRLQFARQDINEKTYTGYGLFIRDVRVQEGRCARSWAK